MKLFDVTFWMPVHYSVVASTEEEAFAKAQALPFSHCDESTWDDLWMMERGGSHDWDQLIKDDLSDPYSEFHIDDRQVSEQEFREFGNKHLVTYQTIMPKNPDADCFAVQILTKNIYTPKEDL